MTVYELDLQESCCCCCWWEIRPARILVQNASEAITWGTDYLLKEKVPGMKGVMKAENHIASASAFVEGGNQEACDDACSICLDEFSDSEPSTITTCKHDFHLHCILEWCQRSSNCPMCWQPISLKDPSSQELLLAVEQERNLRSIPSRNATIYHHLPVRVDDPDFKNRIMQHLAAAAAMRRSHHFARGEGSWTLSSAHDQIPVSSSGSTVMPTASQANDNRNYSSESSSPNTNGAGSSDTLLSFSDMLRSRLSSMSMQYRESISRSASGLKEMLFSRSPSMSDIGSEVQREINAGIATVSWMMVRLETRDDNRAGRVDSSIFHDSRDTQYENGSNGNSNTTTSAS
ncbi:hypothetical protein ACS0TY_015743 [Phlomoides rotata]